MSSRGITREADARRKAMITVGGEDATLGTEGKLRLLVDHVNRRNKFWLWTQLTDHAVFVTDVGKEQDVFLLCHADVKTFGVLARVCAIF